VINFHKSSKAFEAEIEVEGHLIDSFILSRIFDRIMDLGGEFEVLEFRIGKKKKEYSYAKLLVKGKDKAHLNFMMQELYRLGATPPKPIEVMLKPAPSDRVLPEDFYSTTHHPTSIYYKGKWIDVENQMMDKAIVVDPVKKKAYCKRIYDVKKGDLIIVGENGVKIKPPERPREGIGIFEFMSSRTSSEKPSPMLVRNIATEIQTTKARNGRIVVVAGPAVIHTGAAQSLAELIRLGYMDALLGGNGLAVHDVEYALFGTSLGVDLKTGVSTLKGSRNHLAAINEIMKAGSLKKAVEKNILTKGIMYECIRRNVPYALAGSIRDDGPLPEVITDTMEAQKKYAELLKDVDLVIMLSSTLHSVAVGNMLPSTAKVICVDIHPATIIKLMDRGSAQAVGVVTDVGTFLPTLVDELAKIRKSL